MIVALVLDLLFATRIGDAAIAAGRDFRRVDDPADLPPSTSVDLLFVDWGDRDWDWGTRIGDWCAGAPEPERPRIIVYGPHTDLGAHADARAAGLAPMWARSRLVAQLSALVRVQPPAP